MLDARRHWGDRLPPKFEWSGGEVLGEEGFGDEALEAGGIAGDVAAAQAETVDVAEDVRAPRRVGLELHRLLGSVARQQPPALAVGDGVVLVRALHVEEQ